MGRTCILCKFFPFFIQSFQFFCNSSFFFAEFGTFSNIGADIRKNHGLINFFVSGFQLFDAGFDFF